MHLFGTFNVSNCVSLKVVQLILFVSAKTKVRVFSMHDTLNEGRKKINENLYS